MAEGLIYRFVFIFNFLRVIYFSFLDMFIELFFNFSSMSPKFLLLFVIPTEPSIRTHRWCAEGSAEASGSKVLPQWTLNLRVYAHMYTDKRDIEQNTHP